MSELISKIWNFFESDKVSISRKITIPILFFLAAWVIDDMGGFSYQFTNSQKLDYLVKIEKTKEQFQKDTVVCSLLDKMKFDLIHRKTVFEQFIPWINYTIQIYYKSYTYVLVNVWKYKTKISNIKSFYSVITPVVTLSFCLKTNISPIVSYR